MEYSLSFTDFWKSANLFTLVFVRIGAMAFFLPGFAESYVPNRFRLVIAIYFSILLFPILSSDLPQVSNLSQSSFLLILGEGIAGIFWGVVIRMTIFCLQISGAIISQAISITHIFGGTNNIDAQPAIGHILVVGGIALLSIFGMLEIYMHYFVNTYAILPIGAFVTGPNFAVYSSSIVTDTFAVAFQISAAILMFSLLYNVILGVINRAMPQLMVSFVGAPAISAGGLLLLLIMAPTIFDTWLHFSINITTLTGIH